MVHEITKTRDLTKLVIVSSGGIRKSACRGSRAIGPTGTDPFAADTARNPKDRPYLE